METRLDAIKPLMLRSIAAQEIPFDQRFGGNKVEIQLTSHSVLIIDGPKQRQYQIYLSEIRQAYEASLQPGMGGTEEVPRYISVTAKDTLMEAAMAKLAAHMNQAANDLYVALGQPSVTLLEAYPDQKKVFTISQIMVYVGDTMIDAQKGRKP